MFRYDHYVPNRDEARPSDTQWTSSSSLLATAVTVGTTWERMSRFCKNNRSTLIGALFIAALVLVVSICGVFIGGRPGKSEVSGTKRLQFEFCI